MSGRLRTGLAGVAAAAVLLVGAVPAGAGSPSATASGEELITYLTGGKLKVRKKIAYQVVCAANCTITVESKLKLKGPDLGPITSTGSFAAGQVAEAFLQLNKGAREAIKAKIGAAKLITTATATNTTTGEVDSDSRTYRFKR